MSCESIFGHRFEARYDMEPDPRGTLPMQGTGAVMIEALKLLTKRVYVRDVCVRCGAVVERGDDDRQQTNIAESTAGGV